MGGEGPCGRLLSGRKLKKGRTSRSQTAAGQEVGGPKGQESLAAMLRRAWDFIPGAGRSQ